MNALPLLLADLAPSRASDPRVAWAPVVLMIVIGVGFAIGNLALSIIIGPKRTGPGKETAYESGMLPVGDTRRRFNVRFYIVAMIFLVFDVDIVFLYPWATIFAPVVRAPVRPGTQYDFGALLLIEMIVFVAILLVAYVYAWG